MNKFDILKMLKRYELDSDKYIVISGAAMVLLGIKEDTTDIDIAVSEDYYEYLLKNFPCEFERINEYGKKCYMINDIINFSVTYYEENRSFVEGIPIQTIDSLINLKMSLNRDKDKKDIELIKAKQKIKD